MGELIMIVMCPSCGEKGKLPQQLAGIRIKCKKCSASFLVPSPGGSSAEAHEPAESHDDGIAVDGLDISSWSEPSPVATAAPVPVVAPLLTETAPLAAGVKQYKLLTPKDKFFEGRFEFTRLEDAINHYARQGWVVRSMATPLVAGFAGDPREEIVVLLER